MAGAASRHAESVLRTTGRPTRMGTPGLYSAATSQDALELAPLIAAEHPKNIRPAQSGDYFYLRQRPYHTAIIIAHRRPCAHLHGSQPRHMKTGTTATIPVLACQQPGLINI